VAIDILDELALCSVVVSIHHSSCRFFAFMCNV
jgi:hypothetical protein